MNMPAETAPSLSHGRVSSPTSCFTFHDILVIVGVTLIAAIFRFAFVGEASLNGDELWTVRWVQQPVAHILDNYENTGLTMHLYIIFMKAWTNVFGLSLFPLKFPSLVAGTLLIPVTYVIGARWLGRHAATVAAVMTAISPVLISASRTARAYPILAIVALCSMALLLECWKNTRARCFVLLALTNALALCLSLTGVVFFFVQGTTLMALAIVSRPFPWRRVAAVSGTFAISIGFAAIFYHRAAAEIAGMMEVYSSPYYRPMLLTNTFRFLHQEASLLVLILIGVGVWRLMKRWSPEGVLLALWIVVPPIFYFLQKTNLVETAISRYLSLTLPAQYLVAGYGVTVMIGFLVRRLPSKLGALTAAAVTVAALYSVDPATRYAPWRFDGAPTAAALASIADVAGPDDVVSYLATYQGWLFTLEPGLSPISLDSLVGRPGSSMPGRLIVLSDYRAGALSSWSEHFVVEVIENPHYRARLVVLTSDLRPAGPGAFREPARLYLEGLLAVASRGGRLDSVEHRHFRRLMQVHRMLAVLAAGAGDREEAGRHRERFRHYAQRAREAQSRVF